MIHEEFSSRVGLKNTTRNKQNSAQRIHFYYFPFPCKFSVLKFLENLNSLFLFILFVYFELWLNDGFKIQHGCYRDFGGIILKYYVCVLWLKRVNS